VQLSAVGCGLKLKSERANVVQNCTRGRGWRGWHYV